MSAARAVGGRRVAVSNPEKVLYPSGFTKAEVVDYYLNVAAVMLPHLRRRAVTLKRYPDGTGGMFFFEKNCPPHRPEWVKTAAVRGRSGAAVEHCLLEDAAGLAWAANLAALELHVPLAKADAPDRPTAVVFDLDPGPPAGLLDCLRIGLRVRDVLAGVGLACYPKTSGGKGLHVYVPLNTPATFEATKAFAKAVAEVFERDDPGRVTVRMARAGRAGKVFVDWSQNDRHKTTACAYTLRAGPAPTVSTPVTWAEVEGAALVGNAAALAFEAGEALDRVRTYGDLLAPLLKVKQRIPSL